MVCASNTITVTGGSQTDPFTMADLDADGTVGGYVTAVRLRQPRIRRQQGARHRL
ncbi:MAG: hypothetical protein JW759_05475 [Candidatus Coatesbacteria bacterium]|nr:hypothetical protein [Candidatus Coatesbacteria bacterium]